MAPLRILIVDDAAIYRKLVRDLVATVPCVEVVGAASTGSRALEAIESLRPDLVTLDIEMPELDGLSVLAEIKRRRLPAGVIMLSSLTTSGADKTMEALRAGAFDFVAKPSTPSLQLSLESLRADLVPKIEAFRRSRLPEIGDVATARKSPVPQRPTGPRERIEVVAIGVSTGGPSALASLLPKLPSDLPVPIVVVQHMPPVFTRSLAADLDRICALDVIEAADGDPVSPGQVLIAPGGQQMQLQRTATGVVARITDDPPEKSCKPSVDYLFRSAADVYGRRTLALVLTGMGDDGQLGCAAIKRGGGLVIAQDQASSVVFGMPRAVIDGGLTDMVASLSELPRQILQLVGASALAGR